MDLKLNSKASALLSKCTDLSDVETHEYDINGRTVEVIDLGVATQLRGETAEKAGVYVAESALGCLGKVGKKRRSITVDIPRHPAIATLGCQLAGWAIDIRGKNKLGSGPARILARKPGKIIDKTGYSESSKEAALVLETDVLPDRETCRTILDETHAQKLTVAAFRDDTYVGLINVLARVVEVGIFRLNNLGYDTTKIASARGTVPMPDLDEDMMHASNDAIIYGGKVSLETNGWDPDLTEKAVSRYSQAYGKTFKDIYTEANCDFYKIDPGIFAPAEIDVTDRLNGKRYAAGKVLIDQKR